MAKHGRYTQKVNSGRKYVSMTVLILVFLVGLYFGSIGKNKSDADLGFAAETEAVSLFQGTQVTQVPQESSLQQPEMEVSEVTISTTEEPVSTQPAESGVPVELIQKDNTQRDVNEDEINIYGPVLQQYRTVMEMDSEEFAMLHGNEIELDLKLSVDALRQLCTDGELASISEILDSPTLQATYPYVNGETLKMFHHAKMDQDYEFCNPADYFYAYYDIDGKGSIELLIGAYNDYRDDYEILAMYTVRYETPRLLQYVSDDSRAHLTIFTDGTVCLDGSGGASLHTWDFYVLNTEWDMLDKVSQYYINYKYPQSEIVQQDLEDYMSILTPVTQVNWLPLFPEQ